MGCGWLGLPLAISLIADDYVVQGSTTSEEKCELLKKEGIAPFCITLSENTISGAIASFLKNADVLIINVPPKLRGGGKENYVKKMQLVHQEVQKAAIRKIIFVSSTSVYGDIDGEVDENTPPQPVTESGKQLLEAELLFKNDPALQTTIVRFGGLIGPKRHPITMLSGRQNLSNGKAPINLIHLEDCIRILKAIIANSWWNELLNAVYPEHPDKQNYYSKEAQKRALQPPDYKHNNSKKGKLIHSKTLQNVKKFTFKTPI